MKMNSGREPVLVNMEYLDKLTRQVTFNALSTQSQSAFDDYLRRQGIDPDTINEVEVGKILSS